MLSGLGLSALAAAAGRLSGSRGRALAALVVVLAAGAHALQGAARGLWAGDAFLSTWLVCGLIGGLLGAGLVELLARARARPPANAPAPAKEPPGSD